ncbi:MAG: hypothetical protein NVS3B1_20420 [Marmoricola sp.]
MLTCVQCGMQWERPRRSGARPTRCPDCAAARREKRPTGLSYNKRLDTTAPGYRLALAVTNYRLAIEEATAALRLGRIREALIALERVSA